MTFYLTGYDPIAEPVLAFNASAVWQNKGNAISVDMNCLIIPQCGLYWDHLDVKTLGTAEADVSVIGSAESDVVGVLKTVSTAR